MAQVRILENGYLKIPEEMLPDGKRVKYFAISMAITKDYKRILMEPTGSLKKDKLMKKAIYTNANATSPYITVTKLLGIFGINGTGERVVEVKKLASGLIEVTF